MTDRWLTRWRYRQVAFERVTKREYPDYRERKCRLIMALAAVKHELFCDQLFFSRIVK